MDKRVLSQKILKLRNAQTGRQINEKTKKIKEQLFSLPEFKQAKIIMFYLSFKTEVKTEQMIKETLELKKKVVIPVVKKKLQNMFISELKNYDEELTEGDYGILCPKEEFIRIIPSGLINLIIVPGVVFDQRGYRIGYGKGFYDKFLYDLEIKIPTVGLAFDLQISEQISIQSHDVQLDKIVTEKRIVNIDKKDSEY